MPVEDMLHTCPIFSFNPDETYRYVNDAFANPFGKKADEIIGKTPHSIFPFEEAERRLKLVRQVFKTGIGAEIEVKVNTASGNARYFLTFADPVKSQTGEIQWVTCISKDITERKIVEDALKLRESYLTAIIENEPGLAWLKDLEGRFLIVNGAFATSCGKKSPLELVGKTDLDVWPGELAEKYRADDADVIKKKKPVYIEEFISDQEQRKWFETFKMPIFDSTGQVIGTTGFAKDITERKKSEMLLRDSEERYRTLVSNTPLVTFVTDENGIFTLSEGMGLAKLGLQPGQVVGLSVFDVYQDYPAIKDAMKKALAGESQRKEVLVQGIVFDVFFSSIFDQNGKVTKVIGVSNDITERKQAELLLQEKNDRIKIQNEQLIQTNKELIIAKEIAIENEERVKTMFSTANTGVVVIDSNGNIMEWNETFKNYFGYSKAELNKLNSSDITFPEDLEISRDYIKKLRTNQINSFRIEKRFVRKDKTVFWADLYASPLKKNDQVYALLEVVNDISDRKKYEAELILAKEHAEESDRLKTAFLQNMSHEIRTPMNAIMGFSGLLVENYNNQPKLEKFSNIINQRCRDLLDIINDVLDIAKIESGQLSISIEECNLNELFADLTSFFIEHQKRIGKQQIKFSLQIYCDSKDVIIVTDKVKLKQIFINLIGNAFKFTENGIIEGGCKFDNKHNLIFYVTDTGLGIAPDKKHIVFERFAQLNQGANKAIGGTGLGLSIVKGLVELLGGEIWLESEPEKGSTFSFSIPYKTIHPLTKGHLITEKPEEYAFSGKTILVVEDDMYNAEYIREILTNTGLNLLFASFGNDAIKISLAQKVDLVLMDIRLPDIDGYQATRQIKQHKPSMKIIAQTAYASNDEKQKAIEAGCCDYISKPTKKELLLPIIKKQLNNGNK